MVHVSLGADVYDVLEEQNIKQELLWDYSMVTPAAQELLGTVL